MKIRRSELKTVVEDILEELDLLPEGYRKKVIRKGKIKKKLFCKPGQKAKNGRCVPMRTAERTKRKMKGRKSALKRKGKMSRILKKRAKSMRKRSSYGLR